ncbi:hypothetical protein ACFSX9_09770 [Flavobacterium ardleyense]|uniref:Integral membrane protein n=1 Tax=Flavobacterium ardleyense TaxID=2038737 RepID=A0ABW5Z923_9FLAO
MKDTMLIVHFIGLAMGLGTSFAHAFLGKTISKLEQSEAAKFRVQIKGLSQMGTTGIIVLIVSGIYLLIPYWSIINTLPLLILKLVLFTVLVILIVLINRTARKNLINHNDVNLKRIGILGQLTLIISIVIVIIAVHIFH